MFKMSSSSAMKYYVLHNLNLDYTEVLNVNEERVKVFAFFFFFVNHHKIADKAAVKRFFVAQGKTQTTVYTHVCYENEILTLKK